MKIRSIQACRIGIPFKKPFKHATSVRTQTDNIVVVTELEDGTKGYGEGLPRPYVTGETPEGVLDTLTRLDPAVLTADLTNLENVIAFIDEMILSREHFKADRENNTTRCALEISLLDAYCRTFHKRFHDVALVLWPELKRVAESPSVYYDGVLSLDSNSKTLWNAVKMRLYGFRRLKLKVDADDAKTLRLISRIRRIVGRHIDLRIDANESWNAEQTIRMAHQLVPWGISSIEQPLPHRNLPDMKHVTEQSPIPTMLDESLCTLQEAQRAIDDRLCKSFNIRISKCGGFVNSLRIAQRAQQNGITYQLGCLVGETAILSAAGRQMAVLLPSLRYLEGSYDHHLLRDNIGRKDISFGYGGKAARLEGYGLGLEVDSGKQNKYTTQQVSLFVQ